MTEGQRTELRALRADADTRQRVIGGAMARIRMESRSAPIVFALAGSARYLAPVLAAAAVVGLLLSGPHTASVPADLQGAGVLLDAAGNVSEPVLRWSLAGERPEPGEVLVMFAGTR